MLYAGSNLDKARKIFVTTVKHRPRIKLTIRQQTRVLQRTPDERAGPLKDSAASAGPSARNVNQSSVKFSIFRPIEGRPLFSEPPGIQTARAPAI
jgi:hypothetical protein